MKSVVTYLSSTNYIFKFAAVTQLICIAIWGPLISCIGIASIIFILLILHQGDKVMKLSAFVALIFCVISVLIVFPGGSKDDVFVAFNIAVRFFDIMIISILFALIAKLHDFTIVGKLLHLPKSFILIFMISFIRFIPVAFKSIETVIMAQRSRGFNFNLSSFLKTQTYRALLIPYIICILDSAWWMWISMNLRPIVDIKLPNQKISAIQIYFLAISFGLWFL